jgi:hypothetical protein
LVPGASRETSMLSIAFKTVDVVIVALMFVALS